MEDGSFIILAPIKILKLELLLDRQFPISSHVCLKFLFDTSFNQCYHNTTKSDGKVIPCFARIKKKIRGERKTTKHKDINATQHKVGNIAALNT